ncbi:glycosyltransferase family 2 protein [Yoonia sp. BS5-3]|uniref:Glycosyltransferase family 2 protein n=1 Tax=Yoonia phaeophyticola TaxID=3137369 RepID=A0ABZ2V331_9RHOB
MLRRDMEAQKSTWAVVATVDEPPVLIRTFVAWYLHLGASEIWLYFDRPDDPAAADVAEMPGVEVIACDAVHWRRLGKSRPQKHQIRQMRNAGDAYRRSHADWVLHVDADEYLRPGGSVGECLHQLGPQTQVGVVPVAERIFSDPEGTIFDGAFRRPYLGKPRDGRKLFGPAYDLTYRGLTGHAIGKSFARTGAPLQMSIHRPKPLGAADLMAQTLDHAILLHFDGLTRLHWVYKLLRKADAVLNRGGMAPSPHRQRQIDAVLDCPSSGFDLHDELKCIGPALQAILQTHDLWLDPGFSPVSVLQEWFPKDGSDVSAAAFDAWLWHNKGDVLDQFGMEREA